MKQFRVIKPFDVAVGVSVNVGEKLPLTLQQASLLVGYVEPIEDDEAPPVRKTADPAPEESASGTGDSDTEKTADATATDGAAQAEAKPAAGSKKK